MDPPSIESQFHDPIFLDRYDVQELIGSGGFGRIYRARQRTTGQDVAVKVLRTRDPGTDDDLLARFRQELSVCASLHHPNIVRLIDSCEAAHGEIFAVFEWIPGSTLADVIAAEGALAPGEAIHLMSQVLDAVACAHRAGIVHRDLKPANVMVTPTGARRNALVLDFGLGTFAEEVATGAGRITRNGEFLGTAAYAAPEQLRGEHALPSSDLFAWGLVLLECLTGRPAVDGTVAQVIYRQLGPEPIPIPPALAGHPLGELIASVTDKDTARRPRGAAGVLDQLVKLAPMPLPDRAAFASGTAATSSGATRTWSSGPFGARWLIPLHRNANFTGREAVLAEIQEALKERPLVALCGLGGVGKTQLALEHTYRHGHEYDLVAWLRAEQPETLASDFAALAGSLGLPEGEGPDQNVRIDAASAWLERHRRWLIVFDNAPNPAAIRRFLPRNALGHVLVTSRHPSWRSIGTTLEIEELTLEEATGFLLRRTGEADRKLAARLAESLGRLPLALEAAAAYLEATGRSLGSYLGLLEDQQQLLLDSPSSGAQEQNLRGTWELSFRQVEAELPAAADLLRLMAFLAPEDVPFSLVAKGREHLPAELAALAGDPVQLDACVAALRRYSLIKVQGDSASLHRLVQLATRSRLDGAAHDEWAGRALRVVEASFAGSLAGDYFGPEARRLLPHALTVLSRERALAREWLAAGRLLRRAGAYLGANCLHAEAASHLERAVACLESGEPPPEREIASTLSRLEIVLYGFGDLDGATARGERALEIHERILGSRDILVAVDLMNLAWVLRSKGRFEEVRAHCERSREIAAALLGAEHPLAAMPLGPLSRAYWGLGDAARARQIADEATAILEKGGIHHPFIGSCWYSVGQVHFDLGRTDLARRCIDTAIEIGDQAYSPDDPQVTVNHAVRGMIQLRLGDLESARRSLGRAVDSGERMSHWLHEDVATARCLLARVQRLLGDADAAAIGLAQARATLGRVCGERTKTASQIELEYGLAALAAGDPARAVDHGRAAIDALTGYPAAHPYQIPALTLLADGLRRMDKRGEARAIAAQAVAIGERDLEGDHPDLAAAREVLKEA
jgi:tetratricopeptide (TPR) repeat protein